MLSFGCSFSPRSHAVHQTNKPSDIPLKSPLCDLCAMLLLLLRGAHIAGVSKAKILLLLTVATRR
jgi:hypothetical protein